MQVYSAKVYGLQCYALQPQIFLTTGLVSVLVGELSARLKDIADGKEDMIRLEKEAVEVLIKQESLKIN